jgi:hypothetical protein
MKLKLPFLIEKALLDKLGAIHTIVEITKKDSLGNILQRKKFIGKSLTANFLQNLYVGFNNNQVNANFPSSGAPFNSSINVLNLAGSLTYNANPTNPASFGIIAGVGDLTQGIIVGTGTTSPTPQDHVIQTPITHGSGAGQLQYQQQTSLSGVQIVGNNSTLILNRIMVNNSGGTINVSEIGIYANTILYASSFMIYRDLVSGVSVLNTQTLTCQITFQITT